MSRALLLPLTMMIVIATAMAMLASVMLLPMSDIAGVSAPDGTGVVEQFYAAVNETIATGDTAPVQRVVNPSFADENPLPGVKPGRAGLEAYLATLHDADPGLRLEAEVVISSGNQVMTRVRVIPGAARAARAKVPDTSRAIWSPIEVFRVANRQVIGRWGQTDGLTLAQPLTEQMLALPIPTPRIVSLMRIAQAPGTRWDAPGAEGPRLLYIEAGVLEVQAVPAPAGDWEHIPIPGIIASDNNRSDAAQRTQRVMLSAGMSWRAPPGATMSTTNTGSTEASLLVVTFSEPKIPNTAIAELEGGRLPAGVTVHVLASNLATNLGTGAVTVTLEQVSFAPRAGLNLWSIGGPILLAVQAGQLETTTRGAARARRGRDETSKSPQVGSPSTNYGMFLQPGEMVALRNVEQTPARALVVKIQPLEPKRGP